MPFLIGDFYFVPLAGELRIIKDNTETSMKPMASYGLFREREASAFAVLARNYENLPDWSYLKLSESVPLDHNLVNVLLKLGIEEWYPCGKPRYSQKTNTYNAVEMMFKNVKDRMLMSAYLNSYDPNAKNN